MFLGQWWQQSVRHYVRVLPSFAGRSNKLFYLRNEHRKVWPGPEIMVAIDRAHSAFTTELQYCAVALAAPVDAAS